MDNGFKAQPGKGLIHLRRSVLLTLIALPAILLFLFQLAAAAPAERDYYFPWYDNNPAWGMNGNWIMISNQGDGATNAQIYLGDSGTPVAEFSLTATGTDGDHAEWQSPTVVTNGPVKVVSTSGEALDVSQRVVYKDSFNEVKAVSDLELESDYVFTWYDNNPAWGMNGNWICTANEGTQSTSVNIYVGAIDDSATPVATIGPVAPGGHIEWQSPAVLTNGPVRVASTNGQPLVVSQRVIYKNAFNEVMGVGSSRLSDDAMFAWYDNNPAWGMNGNWILVANHDNNNFDAARVQIIIGGTVMHDPANPAHDYFWVAPGGYVTPQFPGLVDGPVEVLCQNCTDGQKLIVSQRVLYKESFEEIQGSSPENAGDNGSFPIELPSDSGGTILLPPPNDMGNNADFNWYDSQIANGMMGDWIMVGNTSAAAANVFISIGGVNMINPANGTTTFSVGAGDIIAPDFISLMDGPVLVMCQNCTPDQKLIVSQRVIYKNSFNEIIGRPRS